MRFERLVYVRRKFGVNMLLQKSNSAVVVVWFML
jgi:hypothetical protein